MFVPKHLFLLSVALFSLCFVPGTEAQVKATAILFRHGQRTPIASLDVANDVAAADATEDLGHGQLTNRGSRQLYENGAILRLKYQHLFPEDGFFRLSHMKIMTSLPERTMMSLQSFMAGFFPPPILDNTLPIWWQPFFCTVDQQGKMIHFDQESCPRYLNHLYGLIMNPPADVTQWMKEDREALDELERLSGTPLPTFIEVFMFAELIKAKIYIEPNLPQWAIDAYYTTLKKYVVRSFTLMHDNAEMIKIRGGPLITEIINNMEDVAQGRDEGRPILIYSAHDMTVFSLAFVLGVQSQIPDLVNYADTMLVDLLENGNVEVTYVNNENTLPTRKVMNVPGCGLSCSLSTFRNALSNMMVNDLDALCRV